MEKLSLCFLVFISVPGAFFQTDMSKKAFVFPRESADSFVTLTAQQEKPLMAFTLCLQAYTDLTRPYSLFSCATREVDNEILIFKEESGEHSVSVGGSNIIFRPPVSSSSPAPLHLCVSWESASGITELWLDGKPMVRKSLKKGYSLGAEARIILGQEQDSFGGDFDQDQSFVGDIGDVNMWDFVLLPDEIRAVHAGETFSPKVLAWRALKFQAFGDVFIKPQLWPFGPAVVPEGASWRRLRTFHLSQALVPFCLTYMALLP